MSHGEPVLFSLYFYAPDQTAPILFTIGYGITAAAFIWQGLRHNSFNLIGINTICAITMTAGYALRIYGSRNYQYDGNDASPLVTFILSQIFIYICPPLLELSNYHILGRLFYYVPYSAPIPAHLVLRIFGTLMLVVEVLNTLGASLAVNPTSRPSQQQAGSIMTIIAISTQVVVITVFFGLAGIFHTRCIKGGSGYHNVKTVLQALYASMALILGRCVYRLVQHARESHVQINDMESLQHLDPIFLYEAYFLVFEASFMLLNSIVWIVWTPGRYLPKEYHKYLAQDGNEIEGQQLIDQRSLGAKIVHVVTFGLLYHKEKPNHASQELSMMALQRT
ncbi:hypothetical protein B0I35DRAFT_388118 [Stachybotrys elegans]|uniref:RTA1 domain protein n=1 Tax=Stachybotrys elegans TaxID=80388 RepID=A0A8K0T2F8_9HYPO|nr:hypothetical protein B0I35DRAFT_388118 [Stachybotrys elegans]